MNPWKILEWWLSTPGLVVVENVDGTFAVYEGSQRVGSWMMTRVAAVENEWEKRGRP